MCWFLAYMSRCPEQGAEKLCLVFGSHCPFPPWGQAPYFRRDLGTLRGHLDVPNVETPPAVSTGCENRGASSCCRGRWGLVLWGWGTGRPFPQAGAQQRAPVLHQRLSCAFWGCWGLSVPASLRWSASAGHQHLACPQLSAKAVCVCYVGADLVGWALGRSLEGSLSLCGLFAVTSRALLLISLASTGFWSRPKIFCFSARMEGKDCSEGSVIQTHLGSENTEVIFCSEMSTELVQVCQCTNFLTNVFSFL